jgi:class 3 adenylate cyclase
MVFTDIQSSTALWGRAPEEMSTAVEMHHDIIRGCIRSAGGYEVKTIGDSFMVAFTSCEAAVNFSIDMQHALHKANWHRIFSDIYDDLAVAAADGVMLPAGRMGDVSLWNGIRVRVGVHFGYGSIVKDDVTHGYDYYGTVVNTAARVESVGHGGQILISEAVLENIDAAELKAMAVKITPLGDQPLRGLDEPVALTQLIPTTFTLRSFPPLRLDAADEDASEEDRDETDGRHSDNASEASNVSHATNLNQHHDGTSGTEHLAKKLAKQGNWGTARTVDVQAQMLQEHLLVKTLLSTTPEGDRITTVARMAEKWRCGAVDKKKMLKGSPHYDETLLRVVSKTMRTLVGTGQLTINANKIKSKMSFSMLGGGSQISPSALRTKGTPRLMLMMSTSGIHAPPIPGRVETPNDER